jgi:plasmid maintenance system antidote protein VapI
MDVGKSIRIALAIHNMNRVALAVKMNCAPPGVTQMCNRPNVRTDTLKKLAKVFGMKVSEFIALGED